MDSVPGNLEEYLMEGHLRMEQQLREAQEESDRRIAEQREWLKKEWNKWVAAWKRRLPACLLPYAYLENDAAQQMEKGVAPPGPSRSWVMITPPGFTGIQATPCDDKAQYSWQVPYIRGEDIANGDVGRYYEEDTLEGLEDWICVGLDLSKPTADFTVALANARAEYLRMHKMEARVLLLRQQLRASWAAYEKEMEEGKEVPDDKPLPFTDDPDTGMYFDYNPVDPVAQSVRNLAMVLNSKLTILTKAVVEIGDELEAMRTGQ